MPMMCIVCSADISHRRLAKYCGKRCKKKAENDQRPRKRDSNPIPPIMKRALAYVPVVFTDEELARLTRARKDRDERLNRTV